MDENGQQESSTNVQLGELFQSPTPRGPEPPPDGQPEPATSTVAPGEPSPNAPVAPPHFRQTISDWANIRFASCIADWPAPGSRVTQQKLTDWLQELFVQLGV